MTTKNITGTRRTVRAKPGSGRARRNYAIWWATACGLVEQLRRDAQTIGAEINAGDHPLR